jgi:hypothetical protein
MIGRGSAHGTMTAVGCQRGRFARQADGPSKGRSPVIFAYIAPHEPLRPTQPSGLHDVLL